MTSSWCLAVKSHNCCFFKKSGLKMKIETRWLLCIAPPTVQRNTRQGKISLGRGFLKKILTKAREKQCFVSKGQMCVKLIDGQGEHMQLRDAPAKPAFLIPRVGKWIFSHPACCRCHLPILFTFLVLKVHV